MAKKGQICKFLNFELVVLEPRIDPRIAVRLGRPVGARPMPIRSGVEIGEPKKFPEFIAGRLRQVTEPGRLGGEARGQSGHESEAKEPEGSRVGAAHRRARHDAARTQHLSHRVYKQSVPMTLEEITITVSSERMSGESDALADTIWTGIQLQQGADSSGLGTLHLDNLVEAVGFLNYTTSPCP